MLRAETAEGWLLITHADHAGLAAGFAAHWGNAMFVAPEPRAQVLHAIRAHDDGWKVRDAHPSLTREGRPSAFSAELVGKYSAFEEIDLADYLAVRERALVLMESDNAYAALLISMHTCNLLTARADRSTILASELPLLDAFIARQLAHQQSLLARVQADRAFKPQQVQEAAIAKNFHLLQAMDNLSLYSCVAYPRAGNLLHPMPTHSGEAVMVQVYAVAAGHFRLEPYPLDTPELTFHVPARRVAGKHFAAQAGYQQAVASAEIVPVTVTISA